MNASEVITNRIIEEMEKGIVPWTKGFNASAYPSNLVSKKPYRGINSIITGMQEFNSPYWLTFKQIQQSGGRLLKGSKGTPVTFYKMIKHEKENGAESIFPLMKYYRVFNLEQTDGIKAPKAEKPLDFKPVEKAESILLNYFNSPNIKETGNQPCYIPLNDEIRVPERTKYKSEGDFYADLFHELGHSTGHETRLNRKELMEYSSNNHAHSLEELIAELTSAFLLSQSNLFSQKLIENTASYLDGWLKVFKKDKSMLIKAASKAQKATDLILGEQNV